MAAAEKIFRIAANLTWQNGEREDLATSGGGWAPQLKQDLPEVVDFARITHSGYPGYVHYEPEDKVFMEPKFYWADANFFNMFDFPLKAGNPANVFKEVNSVVISESSANKYFGQQNPVGKIISFNVNGVERSLTITGVMFDAKSNTHLKPTFVGNWEAWRTFFGDGFAQFVDGFQPGFFFSYIKLTEPGVQAKVEDQISTMLNTHLEAEDAENLKGF